MSLNKVIYVVFIATQGVQMVVIKFVLLVWLRFILAAVMFGFTRWRLASCENAIALMQVLL